MWAASAQTASSIAAILRPGQPLADGEVHFTAVVDGVLISAKFDYQEPRLACRLREDPLLHLRLVVLGHNTVVGAAGASILNAEWLAARGLPSA
jgi:aspartate-semialdehyde dehydrogenase